jgi:hypothetical protein
MGDLLGERYFGKIILILHLHQQIQCHTSPLCLGSIHQVVIIIIIIIIIITICCFFIVGGIQENQILVQPVSRIWFLSITPEHLRNVQYRSATSPIRQSPFNERTSGQLSQRLVHLQPRLMRWSEVIIWSLSLSLSLSLSISHGLLIQS